VPTVTSEKGLESLIVESLVSEAKYQQGQPKDYDRDYAVDLSRLLAFLRATQPNLLSQLGLEEEGPKQVARSCAHYALLRGSQYDQNWNLVTLRFWAVVIGVDACVMSGAIDFDPIGIEQGLGARD
jgi:hypothetical protein